MSAHEIAGTWDETYRRVSICKECTRTNVAVTTAMSDRLSIISDLEISTHLECGSRTSTVIRLTSQQMRDISSYLMIAADRVDELEQMREGMIAGLEVAA